MCFLYILHSQKTNRHYIGVTNNIIDRLARHNAGRSKSTKHGIPWRLVYSESFPSKSDAMRREHEIKARKSRTYIQALIAKKAKG